MSGLPDGGPMRALLLLAALALLGPAVAAGLDAAHAVTIKNSRYDPQVLQVRAGDTVTWTNLDTFAVHTVTAYDGTFGSANLGAGQGFAHTFASPGIVPYHCLNHGIMQAIIVVLP